MKKIFHNQQLNDARTNTDVDMTPMLDIVFILLIFFIVTTSFVKEQGLMAKRPAPSVHEPSVGISLTIDEEGNLRLNQRHVEMARLVANLQMIMAEQPVNGLTIKAHAKAQHGIIVEAMNEAKLAGIDTVSLAVKKA